MNDSDFKRGQNDANKGLQPSPPKPQDPWQKKEAYETGYHHQKRQNEKKP
jgi:hypothetical protein